MFNYPYWDEVETLVLIYEPLYSVLWIVYSEVVFMMPFVYELIWLMIENLVFLIARDWVLQIIKDYYHKSLKHPLHAVGN